MRLLVCGGAGFIGSTFVRQRLLEHGDEVTVLDKLTYAGREENFHDFAEPPGFRFVRGAIEDPAAVAGAIDARSPEAIVNFAAETHVDRSIAEPDAFVHTHALGTYVLLEAARARTRCATCRSRPTRCTARSRRAPSPRSLRCALLALLGHQDRRGPARAELLPHLRPARADLPRLEQLRPLSVSGEADPADDPQCAARRSLPVYGDGMQVRNWIHSTDFAARDRPRARARHCRARSTTRAAPTRSPTSRWSSASSS